MTEYYKLVRDRIPEIIETDGLCPATRILEIDEFTEKLTDKLSEELAKFKESGEIDELVDLVEIVQAIVTSRGISWPEFETLRQGKRDKRGGFEARIFLETVDRP